MYVYSLVVDCSDIDVGVEVELTSLTPLVGVICVICVVNDAPVVNVAGTFVVEVDVDVDVWLPHVDIIVQSPQVAAHCVGPIHIV